MLILFFFLLFFSNRSLPRLSSICAGLVFGVAGFDQGVPRPEPLCRSPIDRPPRSVTRCSTPLPRGAAIIIGALPRRGLSTDDLLVDETG